MSDRTNHVIYALVSTREPKHYRYVGQCRAGLRKRLYRHRYNARTGQSSAVYEWIRDETEAGFEIRILSVEQCDPDNDVLNERERYWIARLRDEGHDLLNMDRGGGYVPLSEEGRAKSRAAALKFIQTPAGRASAEALAAWCKTQEGREVARAKGKTFGRQGGLAAQKWRRETPEGRELTKRLAAQAGRAAAEWRRNTPEGQAEVERQRERLRAVASKGSKIGNHNRHHRNKGIVSPECDLCRQESGQQ